MSIVRPEDLIITEIVGDMEMACDYSDDETCSQGPAEWVLFLVRCECGVGGTRLACDGCTQMRIASDDAVECDCGEVTAPARLAYSYIEHVNKSFA